VLQIIIKTGIDLTKNDRILSKIEDKEFLKRIYHPSELELKNKLVSIFCLKEAVFKALNIKVCWHDTEIKYENNKPIITLSNRIKPENLESIDCSISHEDGFTIGLVVILLN
jgi:holo-[acyl-carrier-protein] synthase